MTDLMRQSVLKYLKTREFTGFFDPTCSTSVPSFRALLSRDDVFGRRHIATAWELA